jgi:hypothetical protein
MQAIHNCGNHIVNFAYNNQGSIVTVVAFGIIFGVVAFFTQPIVYLGGFVLIGCMLGALCYQVFKQQAAAPLPINQDSALA